MKLSLLNDSWQSHTHMSIKSRGRSVTSHIDHTGSCPLNPSSSHIEETDLWFKPSAVFHEHLWNHDTSVTQICVDCCPAKSNAIPGKKEKHQICQFQLGFVGHPAMSKHSHLHWPENQISLFWYTVD